MSYTAGEFLDELSAVVAAEASADDTLMLNVAGRWTAIKGITLEAGNLILIESVD